MHAQWYSAEQQTMETPAPPPPSSPLPLPPAPPGLYETLPASDQRARSCGPPRLPVLLVVTLPANDQRARSCGPPRLPVLLVVTSNRSRNDRVNCGYILVGLCYPNRRLTPSSCSAKVLSLSPYVCFTCVVLTCRSYCHVLS